jgi:hypothetical protein
MNKKFYCIALVLCLAMSLVIASPVSYVGSSKSNVAFIGQDNILTTKAHLSFNSQLSGKGYGTLELIGQNSNNDRITLNANLKQTSSEVYCYEGSLYFHGVYTGTATYWKKGVGIKTLTLRTVLIDYDLSGKKDGIVQGYSNEGINFEIDNIPIESIK